MAKTVNPAALVPLDLFGDIPLRVELAYARPDNLLFGERIYRPDARLWLHEELAKIVLLAAKTVHRDHNLRLVGYDGLRTIEAQQKMLKTSRVKANPHWLEEPKLLSSPGGGGHPRGMAIDLDLETLDGKLLDMGTAFDYLAEDAGAEKNPAHRQYPHLSETIRANRAILEDAMTGAAEKLGIPLLPLPQEWWDFRLMPSYYEQFTPLSDTDLPPEMRMMDIPVQNGQQGFSDTHFEDLRARLNGILR